MGSKQPSKPLVLSLLLLVVHFRVVGILKASEIPQYTEWENNISLQLHFDLVLFYIMFIIKNPSCSILFLYVVYEWLTADYCL